ncbi:MAG: hypothetical protein HY659_00165 [Rhizobiales bacterium]|nr:hypothetical protein [Hyphomicrobiales bacterium]
MRFVSAMSVTVISAFALSPAFASQGPGVALGTLSVPVSADAVLVAAIALLLGAALVKWALFRSSYKKRI